ncbi:MAG: hypothetical protein LBD35_03700 [Prevotellaceae bacterium]|nr:hypothetical protein [Prevotellaceae bacterium]
MIFDNIRRNLTAIFVSAFFALALFCSVTLLDIRQNGTIDREWACSVFSGLPDFIPANASVAVSIALLLLTGLLLYKINMEHLSVKSREHLLVFLWIIQTGGFTFLHVPTEAHFAAIFILCSCDSLFHISKKTIGYSEVFMSAMYLGLASVFCSIAAYLFVAYIIALYRFKYVTFRDWAIAVVGFLMPFYFSSLVSFFVSGSWSYPIRVTLSNLVPEFPVVFPDFSAMQIVFVTLVLLLTLAKILAEMKFGEGLSQKTISSNLIFSIFLLFSVVLFVVFASKSKSILMIIFTFATPLLRVLFVIIKKNFLANLIFAILAACSFACLFF